MYHKYSAGAKARKNAPVWQQVFAFVSAGKPPMGIVPCMAADVESIHAFHRSEHMTLYPRSMGRFRKDCFGEAFFLPAAYTSPSKRETKKGLP